MQALRFEISRALVSTRALAIVAAICVSLAALPATAQTIDRVKAAGRINLGYIPDALPFTVRAGASGAPEGYSVELCKQIVDRLKTRLAAPQLALQWVPVTGDNRLREVQQGRVDLLCTPTSVTIARFLSRPN